MYAELFIKSADTLTLIQPFRRYGKITAEIY